MAQTMDYFVCPKCGEHIVFDDILNGEKNLHVLSEYKAKLELEMRKQVEEHIRVDLRKKLEIDLQQQLQSENEKTKLQFEAQLQTKLNEINLKNQIELNKLQQEKTNALTQFELVKNKLDMQSQEFETVKKNLEQQIRQDAELKLAAEKNKMLQETQNQITTLNREKDQAIMQAQTLENKLYEEKTAFEQKLVQERNNVIMQKDLEKKELDATIAQLQSKLESIETKLKLTLTEEHTKQIKQLEKTYTDMMAEKDAEITSLKVANATNRIMNNKVKGENWENEVEAALRKLALNTNDKIYKLTHGGKKADFLQTVMVDGREVGKIVFECKNAEWKDTWIPKLAQDMIEEHGDYAILVATSVDDKFHTPFLVSDSNKNIFIANPESFELISMIIRRIITIEAKMKSESSSDDKILKFRDWMGMSFATFKEIFKKSLEGIEASEKTIKNKIDDIAKHREKLSRKWEELMLNFLDNYQI